MKEICFVRVGDTIKKLNYRLGISIQSKPEKNTVLGYNYLTLKDGSDDIQLVKNYEPYFISSVTNEDVLKERGYNITCSYRDRIICNRPSGVKYCVKPLETLEEISKKLGVSVEEIMLSNKLNTHKLFVGQVLYI